MQQKNPNRYILFSVGVLTAALLLSVFRMIIMVKHMQINTVGIDYYLQRSMTVTVFDVAAAVTCAVCVFFSVRMGRKARRKLEFDTSGVIFTSALVGFMLLSMGLYLCYRYFSTTGVISVWEMVPIVLAVLAAIPFFYYSSKHVVPVSTRCALLALIPVLLTGARLIVDYSAQKDYPTSAISVYHIPGGTFAVLSQRRQICRRQGQSGSLYAVRLALGRIAAGACAALDPAVGLLGLADERYGSVFCC